MSKRPYIKLSWYHRRKRLQLQETPWKKLPSKLRRLSCPRRPYLMIGKSHSLVCNKETRLSRPLKSSSSKSKMIFFRLNLKFQEWRMRPRKSKRPLRTFPTRFKRWEVMKSSLKRDNKRLKMRERDWMSNMWCLRTPLLRLKMNHKKWTLKKLVFKKKWTFLRNRSCHFIPKPKRSEMILWIMLPSKRLLRKVLLTCLNRLSKLIRTLLRKKLRSRICLMRFRE